MNMRFILLLTLCLQACAGTVTTSPDTTQQLPDQPKSQAELVAANNAMAGALFLLLPESDENVFFSPISLTAAFGLAHPGAAGKTAREMEQLFGFTDARTTGDLMADLQSDNELAKLTVANAAWITDQYPVKQSYLGTIQKEMQAWIETVDFRQKKHTAKTINNWVSNKTNQHIPEVISPEIITDKTSMLLTNAVWFKAKWASLEIFGTQKKSFYSSVDETQQADMMGFKTSRHRYIETPMYQAVDIDYEGGQFALSVILPKARNGLADVESNLEAEGLAKIGLELESSALKSVDLQMPRITMQKGYDLITQLESLGLSYAFDKNRANFRNIFNIFDGRRHFISYVVQKSYVTIDETGTEAAAATGLRFETTGWPGDLVVMNVNHPYLVTIRHRPTGTIIFVGRVASVNE